MVDALMVIRMAAAIGLVFVACKHAEIWGRFFMFSHRLQSLLEVSAVYLRPQSRFVFFHLLHVTLLFAVWLLWPYGHWGLLAIPASVWAFTAGMRSALLCYFVRMLLHGLEEGLSVQEAWVDTKAAIGMLRGLGNPNFDRHAADPSALVRYVAAISPDASEIESRWTAAVEARAAAEVRAAAEARAQAAAEVRAAGVTPAQAAAVVRAQAAAEARVQAAAVVRAAGVPRQPREEKRGRGGSDLRAFLASLQRPIVEWPIRRPKSLMPGRPCPICGELVPGGFEICWNCDTELGPIQLDG